MKITIGIIVLLILFAGNIYFDRKKDKKKLDEKKGSSIEVRQIFPDGSADIKKEDP